MSTGGFAVPRTDFTTRNLGTGRPTIQCTACGEHSHWRREFPYDNCCTTWNNHDHATHMCRAPKQTPQQSPVTCVYVTGCGQSASTHASCNLGELHSSTERGISFPHSTPGAVPLIPTCIQELISLSQPVCGQVGGYE